MTTTLSPCHKTAHMSLTPPSCHTRIYRLIKWVKTMKYANLIIDNNSEHTDMLYSYGYEMDDLKPGDKVVVPFSLGNKRYDAYVHSITVEPDPRVKRYKLILDKDDTLSLPSDAISVSEWMRDRYFCKYIDGIRCFLPAGASPKRKTKKAHFEDIVERKAAPPLTKEQEHAVNEIVPHIREERHKVFLVHGVTSSGKTEVYINIIEECLSLGKTAIMLVPEISLTGQTINRFRERFDDDQLAILHSKLSKGQRYEQWMRVKDSRAKVVIGARSAIFAPLDNIGAIILDEEHESTYKSDMTPKYDAIEVAILRAKLNRGAVILGSATPSMTSYYKADKGEYKKITLKSRYNKTPLPKVETVDMREELKEGNKSIFSRALYEKALSSLEAKRQIIMFLNRRGYSTFLSCRSCGYVVKCEDCDISMTYHKAQNKAICHFCGKKTDVPKTCPSCASKYIRYFGAGTEKLEEMAALAFPQAKVERLDLDTARKKGSAEGILKRFKKGDTNILIGTQLVAKGLDFNNVGLVGIVSADITLNIPDYRSPERTFQLITQAAGRSGRGEKAGQVVIQSYTPEHYAIVLGGKQNYEDFYNTEIKFREKTFYPPFCDIIYLVLASKSEADASEGAAKIKDYFLRKVGKDHRYNVLGPKAAPITKSGELFRYQLFIKCSPENWDRYKEVIKMMKAKVLKDKQGEWILSVDINPFGFM